MWRHAASRVAYTLRDVVESDLTGTDVSPKLPLQPLGSGSFAMQTPQVLRCVSHTGRGIPE